MELSRNVFRAGWVVLLGGFLAAAGGCAMVAASRPDIDPAARREIERMCAAVGGLDRYRMTVESITDERLPSGQLVQVGRTSEIRVARPDRMALTVANDSGGRWAGWLSGGILVLLDEVGHRVARVELPGSVDEAIEELGRRYGLDLPLADIVSGLRRADLLTRVQTGLYLGTGLAAGVECHHVLFRQPVVDWQAWIAAGEPALPRRILLTFKDEPDLPVYEATITEWDVSPPFDEETWKPRLPADARHVTIEDLLEGE